MLFTSSGSLPHHQYVSVDGEFIGMKGPQKAVWFGLHAHVGRAWGCTVMLESGAVYRNLPPHALMWDKALGTWSLQQAQLWDCYSHQFSIHAYTYLSGLGAVAEVGGDEIPCSYLFTVIPYGDGFTEAPEQDKEFMFLRTKCGHLTIQPTNRIRFVDNSFTSESNEWPKLQVQKRVYSCEGE